MIGCLYSEQAGRSVDRDLHINCFSSAVCVHDRKDVHCMHVPKSNDNVYTCTYQSGAHKSKQCTHSGCLDFGGALNIKPLCIVKVHIP